MLNKKWKPNYMNGDEGKRKEKESRHHAECSSLGGLDTAQNIIRLFASYHDARHRVFANGGFREQLFTLLKVNQKTISDAVKNDILDIISMDNNRVFKKGVYQLDKRIYKI